METNHHAQQINYDDPHHLILKCHSPEPTHALCLPDADTATELWANVVAAMVCS